MKSIPIRKFSAHHELAASENLTIRKVKALLNGKDFIQELHRHDFFFLLALENGKGDHEIDFTPYKVTNNSIFLLRPGQVHQLALKAGCMGYLVSFKTDFFSSLDRSLNQLLRKASARNFCQLDAARFKKMLAALDAIFNEYSEKQENYQEVIKANLQIFFLELLRQRRNVSSSSKKENTYRQERLEEFLELLESHIHTHKQVQQYADMLNLSVYQLNSITKVTLSKTPSELIDEQTVLEAKRQLIATSNQVSQIADHLGYSDVSYFIRFFKKHTGFSPEAFRSNSR